jgi:hypothetical protein
MVRNGRGRQERFQSLAYGNCSRKAQSFNGNMQLIATDGLAAVV